MPEGDTIHAAAARVRAALGPGPIVEARIPRLAAHAIRIVGRPVSRVWSHGKHLIIEADAWAVRTHLGMHGRWTTHARDQRPRPSGRLRVLIGTDSGWAAGWAAPDVAIDRTPSVRQWLATNLGPDLITADPGAEVVAKARLDPNRSLEAILLDQRVAAGIGNVYKSELCFRAGVHPSTPVGELSVELVEHVFHDAAVLLRRNSHRRDRLTTDIDRPGQRLWVYGRRGRGCRRCNTPISFDGSGERVTYWCPSCQPPPSA